MVILDESGSSGGDSSSTLMNSFSRKNKGKMIESSPRRKNESRVLQIGGDFEEVGEDEIDGVIEAIRRSKVDLRFGGTSEMEN